jgi:hypothetical protein
LASATLDPERVRRVLLWVVAAITVLTIAARGVAELAPGSVAANALHFFDATFEQSVPTVFSTLLLLTAAGLVAALAHRASRRRARWWLLAAVLAFLALDEAVGFHEASVPPLRRLLDAGGLLYYTWVVPAALFVAIVVLAFRPLLADLDRRQRTLFATAAALFFGGALGFELVEGALAEEHGEDGAALIPVATAQECLEMVGSVLLVYVLMDRLVPWGATLRLERGG